MRQYEVIIIGSGPAGYVCAIRCAQLGMKVACVEEYATSADKLALGGTCLNVGCIPSKALLDSSHHVEFLNTHAAEHGVTISKLAVDIPAMQKRKDNIVQTLTGGIAGLLKKNKVDVLHGSASLVTAHQIHVQNAAANTAEDLQATCIVIASGSIPVEIPIVKIDNECIVDSSGALAFQTAPKRLGIIGAGAIGLEMGSVWNRLGAEVVILEAMPEFLPAAEQNIATEAFKIFTKQGLDIRLNSLVTKVTTTKNGAVVTYTCAGEKQSLSVDKLVVAVGRKANTDGLKLDAVNIKIDQKGFIEVDAAWQTSVKDVYAIGDVIGGAMLAHKGSEEGIALAEQFAGQAGHVNYDTIPWVIYTWPEVAWAGKTEEACQAENIEYQVGMFPFMALGRARAMGDAQGLFKIIADKASDKIIGVHILGPNASELISEAVVAMEAELSAEDLARTIHAHPSLAEGLHEAALAVAGRTLHM